MWILVVIECCYRKPAKGRKGMEMDTMGVPEHGETCWIPEKYILTGLEYARGSPVDSVLIVTRTVRFRIPLSAIYANTSLVSPVCLWGLSMDVTLWKWNWFCVFNILHRTATDELYRWQVWRWTIQTQQITNHWRPHECYVHQICAATEDTKSLTD